MGRILGKCKGAVGEIAVVGVRTRAKSALAMAAAKKIKKSTVSTTARYNVYHLRSRRPVLEISDSNDLVVVDASPPNCSGAGFSSDFLATSCCSSNNNDNKASSCEEIGEDRCEIVSDPEVESAQTSSRCFLNYDTENRREKKVEASESDDLDCPASRSVDAKSTVQSKMMPSDSEIEDFFATAEKNLQKRFTDKYNFDVVKDVPMEGRFEWVELKP